MATLSNGHTLEQGLYLVVKSASLVGRYQSFAGLCCLWMEYHEGS